MQGPGWKTSQQGAQNSSGTALALVGSRVAGGRVRPVVGLWRGFILFRQKWFRLRSTV